MAGFTLGGVFYFFYFKFIEEVKNLLLSRHPFSLTAIWRMANIRSLKQSIEHSNIFLPTSFLLKLFSLPFPSATSKQGVIFDEQRALPKSRYEGQAVLY